VLYEQAIATYGASGMQYEQALLRCRLAAVLHSLHDDVRAFELNDQALHEFERIGDRNGQNVALVAKGSMHTARYEWEDATAAFDAALALCPDADITHQRASVLAAQARMFENLGSWRDAVAACREALCISLQLEHRSAAADAYAHIGSIRVCLGQHHEALAEYEAAIEQRPHVSSLYASRARVHYLWGSFDDAERDLAVAAQFDPASLRVVYARGWMMIRQRRYIEAVKLVDDHLVRHATDAELWNIRGYANLRSGESDAAVQDYERAQRLSPRSAVLYSTRGRACGHLGRFDEADRDFETAHALRPAMHELFWIEYEAAAVASLRGAPTSQLLDRLTRAMALPYWDGDCVCHSRMTEHLEWDPTFAALRHEARFEALLDDSVRRGIAATAFQIRSARSEDSDVTVSRNSGDFGAAVPPPAAYFHHRSK
jgi:tetratricopeptide (TPR) repeat protein